MLNQYPSNNKRGKNLIVMRDKELGKFDAIPPSSLELYVSMDDVHGKKSSRRFLVSEC